MSHVLHCGDGIAGMAAMPDRSVDHVITDPPYSEHVHTRSRRGCIEAEPGTGRAAFNRSRSLGFEHLTADAMDAAARHFARLAKRWILVFSDTESAHLWREALERHGAEYIRTLFWDKEGGTPQFTGDRPAVACEAITLAHRPGRKRWNGGGRRGIYRVPIVLNRGGDEPRLHTAQKPLELIEQLVSDFSDPSETILDSYAGSGTLHVACKRLGRSALGWELNEAWHAAAVRRIDAAREQFQLPRLERKPKQLPLSGPDGETGGAA